MPWEMPVEKAMRSFSSESQMPPPTPVCQVSLDSPSSQTRPTSPKPLMPHDAGEDQGDARDAEPELGVGPGRGVAHVAPGPVAAHRVLGLLQRPRAQAALADGGGLHVGVGPEDLLAAGAQGRVRTRPAEK